MFMLKYTYVFLVTIVLRTSNSQRRIKAGLNAEGEVRYMVYLIKAPHAPVIYDAWICGGAIVHEEFIITSAACIEDVQYMYAIAGYNKYVNFNEIASDPCANKAKKKVVLSCVPKNYDLIYEKIEKWSFIDIGVVRVESPYDFTETQPLPSCSWVPGKIEINYDDQYQQPKTDAMALGWGHDEKWRKPGDPTDYNQKVLKYSPLRLQEKPECKEYYANIDGMDTVIDKYMLCALDPGNIDINGKLIVRGVPRADGCQNNFVRIRGVCQSQQMLKNLTIFSNDFTDKPITPPTRDYRNTPSYQQERTREGAPMEFSKIDDDQTITFDDIAFRLRRTGTGLKMDNMTRRIGICQNDHGGPLVTWVGRNEVLIGVASVFRISQRYECIGPFLFTSTQCNGAFLDCVINNMTSGTDGRRGDPICELPPEKRGFDIVERRISWREHPDGPAANELIDDLYDRPQRPLHSLLKKGKRRDSESANKPENPTSTKPTSSNTTSTNSTSSNTTSTKR